MPRTTSSAIASEFVGKAIRCARDQVGLTQSQLAERLHASAQYVSGLENGRGNPTVGQLSAVADALRVELHIEFREPSPQPMPKVLTTPPVDRRLAI